MKVQSFSYLRHASCHVDFHLCGRPCKLSGKRGCADECVKVMPAFLLTCEA